MLKGHYLYHIFGDKLWPIAHDLIGNDDDFYTIFSNITRPDALLRLITKTTYLRPVIGVVGLTAIHKSGLIGSVVNDDVYKIVQYIADTLGECDRDGKPNLAKIGSYIYLSEFERRDSIDNAVIKLVNAINEADLFINLFAELFDRIIVGRNVEWSASDKNSHDFHKSLCDAIWKSYPGIMLDMAESYSLHYKVWEAVPDSCMRLKVGRKYRLIQSAYTDLFLRFDPEGLTYNGPVVSGDIARADITLHLGGKSEKTTIPFEMIGEEIR